MKRLIYLTILIFGFFTALCTLAIFIGQTQPTDEFFSELKPCGDLVCYMGIVPDKMLAQDGAKMLRQADQLKEISDSFGLLFQHTDSRYRVNFLASNESVYETDLFFDSQTIDAGAVINQFGAPCFVGIGDTTHVELKYSNATFMVVVDTYPFTPLSPVDEIVLRQSEPCPEAKIASIGMVYEWQGFRPYSIGEYNENYR